jgi:hypothetical protein
MQFFIALSLLVALSATYLLHQFWTRSLESIDEPSPSAQAPSPVESEQLKAA